MGEKILKRKSTCLFFASVFAYILAFTCPPLLDQMNVSINIVELVFVVFIIIGAVTANAYGNLPEPEVSTEVLNELEEMIRKEVDTHN